MKAFRQLRILAVLHRGLLLPLSLYPLAATRPASAAEAAPQRVVILPFRNLSEKPEDQWLGNSFAESLTMGLLRVSGLQLVERGQLDQLIREQRFGQSALVDEGSAPRLGRLLGARVVVIGSFQKVGDQLQANVRFVDAETGQVDALRFARVQGRYEQLFELQQTLAEQLIVQLEVQAAPQELAGLKQVIQATRSPEAQRHYLEGLMRLRRGNSHDYPAVIDHFRRALGEDPDYVLAYAGLAEVHALRAKARRELPLLSPTQGQDPDDRTLARDYAAKALARDPAQPAVLRALGQLDWAEGKHAEALARLSEALRADPRDTDSVMTYVSFRLEQVGPKLGLSELKQELNGFGTDLDDPWLQFQLAAVGMAALTRPEGRQQLPLIKSLLAQATQRLPDQPRVALLNLSMAKLEQNREAWRHWFDRTRALASDDPSILSQLASQLLLAGDAPGALALAESARQLAPQDADITMNYAMVLYSNGQRQAAEALFAELEAKLPDSLYIPFIRGSSRFGGLDFEAARGDFEIALKRAEASDSSWEEALILPSVRFFLGLTYLQLQDFERARPLFEALRDDPMFYRQAYDFLAQIYHLQKRHREALAAYTAYLSIHPEAREQADMKLNFRLYYLMDLNAREPENLAVKLDLGQIFTELERYRAAAGVLAEALEQAPDNPEVHTRLALLAMAQSDWPAARQALERALKLRPDDVKAWYNLGLACRELKDPTAARSAFEQALKLDPTHAKAREALAVHI